MRDCSISFLMTAHLPGIGHFLILIESQPASHSTSRINLSPEFLLFIVEHAADSIKKYMVMRPENGSQEYVILGQVNSDSKNIEPDMEHLVRIIYFLFDIGVVMPSSICKRKYSLN